MMHVSADLFRHNHCFVAECQNIPLNTGGGHLTAIVDDYRFPAPSSLVPQVEFEQGSGPREE